MKFAFFLPEEYLPKNFKYPESYNQLAMGKLPNIDPWHFYENVDKLIFHFKGLKERYPKRILVPFARRWDTDDVSCFDGDAFIDNPQVLLIHDWAGPGYEERKRRKDFTEWLDVVMFLNQTL